MIKHNKEFKITFRDSDSNGNLRINSLVDFMQDIAREHATVLSVNFEEAEAEYYWIILRTRINIIHTPKIDETIRIETYPSGVDKLFAVREFNIYDKNNNKLGDITGYYVLMQKNKTTPVKIKGNPDFSVFNHEYVGEKIAKLNLSNLNVIRAIERRVFSSDIDVNGHMNNTHYVRWCFDMFDTSELRSKKIKSFQIQYVKEVLENEEVSIYRYDEDYIIGKCNNLISFIGKVEFYN